MVETDRQPPGRQARLRALSFPRVCAREKNDDWLQAEREFWLSIGTWMQIVFGLVVLTVLILGVMILRFEWLGYKACLVAQV